MYNPKHKHPRLRMAQISLLPVLADWFEVGLFWGLRKSEWAQDAGCHHLSSPKQSPLQRAQAFMLSDIKFKLLSGQCIPASQLGNTPLTNPVVQVWATRRWQKNHDNGTAPRLVTSTNIDKRNTVSRVYNLDPVRHKTELPRWSSHSLRVGACTILHSMGFNNTQIKWLLRWRSDAFMTYLRNLAVNSRQHVLARDQAAVMPQFL
jgi:hypothetical protein